MWIILILYVILNMYIWYKATTGTSKILDVSNHTPNRALLACWICLFFGVFIVLLFFFIEGTKHDK